MDWNQLVADLRLDLLLALCIAAVLGAAVGFEREVHAKPAGLRTNILICVGACLFTKLSSEIGGVGLPGDPSRIAAQVVSGVGFIGAGTILRGKGSVTGLTSAATIWVVAAIGMAVGAGWLGEAVGTTFLILLVLTFLGRLEAFVQFRADTSEVSLEIDADESYLERLHEIVTQSGVRVEEMDSETDGDKLRVHMRMRGAKHNRDKAKLSVLRASRIASVSELDMDEERMRGSRSTLPPKR